MEVVGGQGTVLARDVAGELEPAVGPMGSSVPWRRRARVQVVLVALVCFCCPGMFNALASMGGGLSDQSVVANSTAALYAVFVASSLAAPVACRRIGPRATLFLGTLGYLVFVAAVMVYQRGLVGEWVVVVGGALNGLSAGLLWTAQGQLVMAYPSADTKGWALALFWLIFNLGAVFGGVLTAATNWAAEATPSASVATYVAFMAVMAVGSALSLLLADPATVVRVDGSRVQVATGGARGLGGAREELRRIIRTAAQRWLLLLLPLALYSNWFYTYQFSCYNHALFTVRSQGVNNALYWAAQMAGAWVLGRVLDGGGGAARTGGGRRSSLRRRAGGSLLVVALLVLMAWLLAAAVVGVGARSNGRPLDVATGAGRYVAAAGVYLLWGLGDSLVMVWLFWVLGQNSNDAGVLARYSGIVKSVQAGGSALSWKLNSAGSGVAVSGQFVINAALALLGLVTAWAAVRASPFELDKADDGKGDSGGALAAGSGRDHDDDGEGEGLL